MSIASIITALGGIEFIKHLANRRNSRRSGEIENERTEFTLAKETIVFLQEEMLRNHQEIKRLQDQVLELTREKGALEGELAMKRCERRGCASRQPQNGY